MTPSGDAHDFLRKLSASRKEINAGIISVDIIPHPHSKSKSAGSVIIVISISYI